METSSQRIFDFVFWQKLHPSWVLIIFAVGIIGSCIVVPILHIQFFSSCLWLFLAIALLVLAIIIGRKWVLILALTAGFLTVSFRAAPDFIAQDYLSRLIGQTVTITGKITKDPSMSEDGRINLDLVDFKIEHDEIAGHIFVQISGVSDTSAEIQRSDIITLHGKVSEGFGIYCAAIYRPEIIEVAHPEPGDIFLKFRNDFATKIKNYIPMPEAGLGIGYLLGQKSGVDQGIQDALRTVGLTHIIVASGAHLGTLVGFSRKIFGKLSRFASLLMAFLMMLMFLGITGLSASMLRASIITGSSLILWYCGRKIHPLRLIILVAAVTLICNPFYLSDMSWLLSFASFTGIMVITPVLIKYFYGKKKPGILGNNLLSSIAATIMCTPILLYFFGQVSIIGVLANVLILPTISFVMSLVFLTGLFAYFLPFGAMVFGKLALVLLDYQISVANFFAENKAFLVNIDAENLWVFCLYIPIVLLLLRKFKKVSRLCLQ
ncbi:ComEC/Rec2 family competence protein [Candidatus Saccharibacteria bacterium]|nr:ComEC/Rec2 family competence protein [Candidatus Saccharibacteria bacterium]MBR3233758.1 ComEC/Rec2 family competence protein [Candidatus Saccharibacteria bacterium]